MRYVMAVAVIVALALVGCATAYQREGLTGGVSETQFDENVFQVSFIGNGYTSAERANNFTLLRSAELAIEKGFEYFVIVSSQQNSSTSTYTTPIQSTTAFGKTTTTGGKTYFIQKPSTTNIIVCFKEKPQGFAYNAEFLLKALREKYSIQPDSLSKSPLQAIPTPQDEWKNQPVGVTPLVESRIDSDIPGIKSGTVFKLENGQTWQQITQIYKEGFAHHPKVKIYQLEDGFKMFIKDVGSIYVKLSPYAARGELIKFGV